MRGRVSATRHRYRRTAAEHSAVGDDRLMEKAGRAPMRDSFTHGSSAERQEWFDRGFNSGELAQCNTFKAAGL